MSEPKGRGAPWTEERSRAGGRGAAWTEERGTSDEGRRGERRQESDGEGKGALKAPRRREVNTVSAQAVPASGARTGRAEAFGGFRLRWALLLAIAGGLATYAAFPPVGAWPLAAAGPALLVLALTGRSLRGSFACGLAFGFALFVPLLSWLINEAWYVWFALAAALTVIFAVLVIGQRLLLRPARLAGRGSGLVGGRRSHPGPVALRLPLGPARDEPVRRPRRPLGRDRRRPRSSASWWP